MRKRTARFGRIASGALGLVTVAGGIAAGCGSAPPAPATGKVEWDTKVSTLPLGAATVSNDLVFTTLYNGTLLALNRATGGLVYQQKLPTSTNSPIAIAGNTVIVPAGGPKASATLSGNPQLVAYTVS